MRIVILLLLFLINISYATITGTAFKDYNADGIKQDGEPIVSGVSVKAYDINDTKIAEATTNLDGNYTLDVNAPVRLEFELPTDSCAVQQNKDFPSAGANSYGSDIQFVKTDNEIHNFAIAYPYDTSTDDNPETFTSIMAAGDPLEDGTSGEVPSIIKFYFKDTKLAENGGRPYETNESLSDHYNRTPSETGPEWVELTKNSQTGSIHGLAFSRQAQKLFGSALLKRHVGLGPLGAGGIYMIDTNPANNTDESVKFLNLDDIGIATSNKSGTYTNVVINGDDDDESNDIATQSDVIGTNKERGLSAEKKDPSNDPTAFAQIGKLGLGDMDISEDGKYLYVVNLYDRKLYQIDLTNPKEPVAPTIDNRDEKIKSFVIPDICKEPEAGEYRPFGLKIYKDKAYVGIVCSGQDANGNKVANSTADMKGAIYSLDIDSGKWSDTSEVEWTFDYRDNDGSGKPWHIWTNAWEDGAEAWEYGIPIIGDIEFDNTGSLLIGIIDLNAHKRGYMQYGLTGSTLYRKVSSAGDLIRANRILTDSSCEYTTDLVHEFYDDNLTHLESSAGALAGHHTSNEDSVLSTFLDPVWFDRDDTDTKKWYAYGTQLYNNKTGKRVNGDIGYDIVYTAERKDGSYVPSGLMGKANGIGDIETLEIIPPIEIGNRVWEDINKNGIQDANEKGIEGVELFLSLGNDCYNEIARTTTDSNGTYLFNQYNVNKDSSTPGLQENTQYTVCIDKTQLVGNTGLGGTPLEGYRLTSKDINSSSDNPDKTDSDGAVNEDDFVYISFTTQGVGENIHSFDFGFYPLVSLGSLVWFDENNDGNQSSGESGIDGLKVTLLDENGSVVDGVEPVITNNGGKYIFENLEEGVYKVKIESDSTDLSDYVVDSSVQNSNADDNNPNDSNIESGNNTDGYISAPITLKVYTEPVEDNETSIISYDATAQDDSRDSSGNMTLNLGLNKIYTLSGKVWLDSDGDGIQDSNESFKSDIKVKLLDGNGNPIKKPNSDEDYIVTTSTDGKYSFQNLKYGDYKVEFEIPDGYLISPKDATDDELDSDINSNDFTTDTLTLNKNISTLDAGIYTPTISGKVFDDGNGDGAINGTAISSADDTPLYVTLLDKDNKVISSKVLNSDGTYLFDNGVYADTNYTVILSTSKDSNQPTLPNEWNNADGEQAGTGKNPDSTADGKVAVEVGSGNLENVNFGINKKPEAYNVVAKSQFNPNEDNQVDVPDLNITDKEDGTPKIVTIKSLPTNAKLYYDGKEITTPITINDFDNSKLKVDPDDGELTVEFKYTTTDKAGVESNEATVTMPFKDIVISGRLFDDGNGDGDINGKSISSIDGKDIFVNLIGSDGKVLSSKKIENGVYKFEGKDGVEPNSDYNIVLSIVESGTTPELPTDWNNADGESIGLKGNDGTANGDISISIKEENIENINFGINKKPVAEDKTEATQPNPGGDTQVKVPTLPISDNEDGTPSTVTIKKLPTNAKLYYDGVEVKENTPIENFQADKFTIDPDNGDVTVVFEYTTTDKAGVESDKATITLPFKDIVISGKLFDDGNNNGKVDGKLISEADSKALFIVLLDKDGNRVASKPLSNGEYSFSNSDGVKPNSEYRVILTDSQDSTKPTLPTNWNNADGENIGLEGLDNKPDGEIVLSVKDKSIENINFGINKKPVAEDKTEAIQLNPGGEIQVKVPTLPISDNEDGTPSTVTITKLPTNAKLYYDGNLVEEGVEIEDVDPSKFSVDPDDGSLSVVFDYTTTDRAGVKSDEATITMPFKELIISGHVFNDGNNDGIVDGKGISAPNGVQLYVTLLDSDKKVLESKSVNSDGSYSFNNNDGIRENSDYTIVLTTKEDSTTPSLPINWSNLDGEHIGIDAGTDGKNDGVIAVHVDDTNVVEVNFGINKKPVAGDKSVNAQLNPGGNIQVKVPDLEIEDNEDGTPKIVTIETVPAHGVLYYNGKEVKAGDVIKEFNNELLTVDPDDGDQVVSFTYTTTDSVGVKSDIATVSMRFVGLKISGNVFDDGNGDETVNGTKISKANQEQLYAILVDDKGKLLASKAIKGDGSYSFSGEDGIAPNRDYTVILSIKSDKIEAILPQNWQNADGEHIGLDRGLDNSPDGKILVKVKESDIKNINFGINQQPLAKDVNATEEVNPGRDNRVDVPILPISDKEDTTPKTITIKTLPTNGILYYDNKPLKAGDIIKNFDNSKLKVDPDNGDVVVSFTYTTTDRAGFESNVATVNMPFKSIKISGNIFDDGNGDEIVNGIRVSQAGESPLFVNLLDTNNELIASYPLELSGENIGKYLFDDRDISPNNTYRVILTTSADSTTPLLPKDWSNDGEAIGTSSLDGLKDGAIDINIIESSIEDINFGINKRPTTQNVEAPLAKNPHARVDVIDLMPSDREDGVPPYIVTIDTLPTEGTLYYNEEEVSEGQNITDFNNSLLTVEPNKGDIAISFRYSATDRAGVKSESSRVRMPFFEEIALNASDDEVEANTQGATTVIDVLSNDATNDGVTIKLVNITDGEILRDNDTAVGGTNLETTDTIVVPGEGVWQVQGNRIVFTAEDGFDGVPTPIYYLVEDQKGNQSNIAEVNIKTNCTCKTYESSSNDSVPSFNIFGMLILALLTSLVSLLFRKETFEQ